jgi:hypothetical protein
MREAGTMIRENPIPVLLTAAGAVWLTAAMASSGSSARSRASGGHVDEDMDSFGDFAEGHGYAQRSRAVQLPRQAGAHLANLVREQPVALGAIALAVGALLGAALPNTDYENRLFGESRKRSPAAAQPGDTAMTDE